MLKIYKASAGSGKTFTLTREYLTLLLGYQDKTTGQWHLYKAPAKAHRHILAITFTNKATDEMVQRIIAQLALLGRQDPRNKRESPYLNYFTELFGEPADKIERLAADVLYDLLFDFAYFHVSTIDAFFQNVLRTFAREIELPDNFGLELNNAYAVALGVAEMFNNLNDDPRSPRNRWLRRMLRSFINRSFMSGNAINIFSRGSNTNKTLVGRLTLIINEDFKIKYEEFASYISNLDRLIEFGRVLDRRYNEIIADLRERALRLTSHGDFEGINSNIRGYLRKTASGNLDTPGLTLPKIASGETPWFVKKYWGKNEPDASLGNEVTDFCTAVVESLPILQFCETCRPGIELLGILACVLARIEELCRDNDTILLSETNTLLHDIINDDETPFVYERLGYYLNHFLIDEFQDTSKMQWENLRPMVSESMSNANYNLIIGDEKQCIYRFRNSDPALLGHEVADHFDSIGRETSVEGNMITQNNNWRSCEEIVRFNNTLFRFLGHAIGAPEVYDSVVQAIDPGRLGNHGKVSVTIFDSKADDSDEQETPEKTRLNRKAIAATVNDVVAQLKGGRRMRDIAILIRKHSEGEEIINAILGLNSKNIEGLPHIEVASADAMPVTASSAVRLVIGALRLMITPREIVKSKDVDGEPEGSIERKLSNEYRLNQLARWYHNYLHTPVDPSRPDSFPDRSTALAMAVERVAAESAEYASSGIAPEPKQLEGETLSDKLTFYSLDALVDLLLDRFVLPEVMEQETIFLHAFHDLIADYQEQGTEDVRSFLNWWDSTGSRATLQSSPDVDAIRVMTIHQSKGLEFPCVIIPGASWKMVESSTPRLPAYNWMTLDKDTVKRFVPDLDPDDIPMMLPLELKKDLTESPVFASQAETIYQQQRIDNLNVAYVAFTRATEELIVYGTDKPDSLALLIVDALNSVTESEIDHDLNDNIADPVMRAELRKWLMPLSDYIIESTDEGEVNDTETTDTAGQQPIVEFTVGDEPLKPRATSASKSEKAADTYQSMLGDELPPFKPGVDSLRSFAASIEIQRPDFYDPRWHGIFIHNILSRLNHPDRLPLIVHRACHRANLTEEQEAATLRLLTHALSDPRARSWFEGYRRVANERTLLYGNRNLRADRIVWHPDGTIDIIDYKSGHIDAATYHSQVRRYVKAMRRTTDAPVRGFLWYLTEGRIEPVEE